MQGEKAVDKALEMIGEWKSAFGQQSGYKAVNEIFSELQREGYQIPETEVASASFTKKAPDWVLGDRCHMCRSEFNRFKVAFRVSQSLSLSFSLSLSLSLSPSVIHAYVLWHPSAPLS